MCIKITRKLQHLAQGQTKVTSWPELEPESLDSKSEPLNIRPHDPHTFLHSWGEYWILEKGVQDIDCWRGSPVGSKRPVKCSKLRFSEMAFLAFWGPSQHVTISHCFNLRGSTKFPKIHYSMNKYHARQGVYRLSVTILTVISSFMHWSSLGT